MESEIKNQLLLSERNIEILLDMLAGKRRKEKIEIKAVADQWMSLKILNSQIKKDSK